MFKEGGDKCSLEIPRLLEDQALCPTLATFRYLQDTRTVRSDEAIFLFVAAVPPHGNLLDNNLVRDVQSHMGRTDTSKLFDSSEYIDDVMETSSIDYYISEERKVIKNRNKQPASPSPPSVYRRRATPISDSDFEQPVDRIVKMPSKKKQLMLMKKFQPSKHVLRQPSPSSEEVDIDQDGPFFFDRSISPGVGPSVITANDIFTPSPVHSARLLSPFAGDRSISPSTSPLGKGKAKANFTARISSLVSSLLPSDNKKQRPPTPPLPLGQQKRSLSPSAEDNEHLNSVRIVSRQTAFPQNNELIRANAENLRLQLQLDSLTKQPDCRSSTQLAQRYDDSSGHSRPLYAPHNSSGDNFDSI
jgi:hypothetical protein